MIKKGVLCLVLLGFVLLSAGCETTMGAAKGSALGAYAPVEGTVKGAVKDTNNIWQALLKIDGWMRENLW